MWWLSTSISDYKLCATPITTSSTAGMQTASLPNFMATHLAELLSIQFRRWGWPDHISTARQTKVNNNRIYIRFMNTQQHITKDASAGSQLFGTHSGSGTVRNHVLDINTSVTLSITLKNTSNIMSTPCRHWKLDILRPFYIM